MPRNACRECRTRKIKCLVEPGSGGKCERCINRNLACSYITPHQHSSDHGPEPQPLRASFSRPLQPYESQHPPHKSSGESNHDGPNQPAYRLTHEIPGLDIGAGRPPEILREGEFMQSLLLLYFSNFSDVHFLFDEELFLRQVVMGQVPKIILYSMMALSIRYSHAPFDDAVSQAHRGEILYDFARELLKDEFDVPSVTVVQAYVLLSTYKLTFGGSRQANVYLGFAVNMVKALRLLEDAEVDPLQLELDRRLVATIALMDRILSPALRFPLHMASTQNPIPKILNDDDFSALKHRSPPPTRPSAPGISQTIVDLTAILAAVCQAYHGQDSLATLSNQESELRSSGVETEPHLAWTEANLDHHQQADTLRRFTFMHTLYHHVGQLIYFKSLSRAQYSGQMQEDLVAKVSRCHHHARSIVTVAEYVWTYAGFDLHNFVMGQCITVATVVHTHALLLAPSPAAAAEIRARIETLRACVGRIKRHCRMFNWVSTSLDQFLRLCNQANQPLNEVFGRDPALLGQMLQLGSHFERLDYRTGGRVEGLESLLKAIPGGQPSPHSRETWSPVSTHAAPAAVSRGHHMRRLHQPVDLATQSQDWTLDSLAWAFTDSSLPQLYALPNG